MSDFILKSFMLLSFNDSKLKKFFLFPILLVLLLFGAIIILSQGSAIAPFIYTIF